MEAEGTDAPAGSLAMSRHSSRREPAQAALLYFGPCHWQSPAEYTKTLVCQKRIRNWEQGLLRADWKVSQKQGRTYICQPRFTSVSKASAGKLIGLQWPWHLSDGCNAEEYATDCAPHPPQPRLLARPGLPRLAPWRCLSLSGVSPLGSRDPAALFTAASSAPGTVPGRGGTQSVFVE